MMRLSLELLAAEDKAMDADRSPRIQIQYLKNKNHPLRNGWLLLFDTNLFNFRSSRAISPLSPQGSG